VHRQQRHARIVFLGRKAQRGELDGASGGVRIRDLDIERATPSGGCSESARRDLDVERERRGSGFVFDRHLAAFDARRRLCGEPNGDVDGILLAHGGGSVDERVPR
jgi:hypothetical protein